MDRFFGTITAKNDNLLSVVPDGATSAIKAVDCIGCRVADRCLIEIVNNQALATAIVGGVHGGEDWIVDTGVSQGWYYQLFHTGRIHAFRTLTMATSTAGFVTATVSLPCTMSDTDYVIQVNPGIGNVSAAYDIYANRSTSQAVIALYVSSTGSWLPTTGVSLTLDGFVDGAVPPSGTRLPDYTGATEVTPLIDVQQVLPTQNTSVLSDVTVFEIPRADRSNESGGTTVTIGG